jgi:hypothetical protein
MRKENFSVGNLEVDSIVGGGATRYNKIIYLNAALGSDGNDGLAFSRPVKTIAAAKDKITTLKNEAIVLQGSASFATMASAAAGTWSHSLCSLIGTGANPMNKRSRISQSAAYTPMFTVSGYGNEFKNLYFSNEVASASNLVEVSVTGTRNTFENVHFLNPYDAATQGAEATATAVDLLAEENYFKGCVFGNDAAARAAGSLLRFGGGTPRAIFDDCFFLMNASANAAFFISSVAGIGLGVGLFRNCHFFNHGTSLTYGIDTTGLHNFKLAFDSKCSFYGCGDIADAANESHVIMMIGSAGVTDETFSMALPYDHTA